MRRGKFNQKWKLLDDTLVGISLGSDFCTEHEIGITSIRNAFDIKKSTVEKKLFGLIQKEKQLFGIDVRTINKNVARFFENDTTCLIGYRSGNPAYLKSLLNTEKITGAFDFIGLWSNEMFVIISTNKQRMYELWDAFERCDIALFTGSTEAFSNGSGLNIMIPSKMEPAVLNDMLQSDLNAFRLQQTADETGIVTRLQKAKKQYFALSPRWNAKKDGVKFWLNPNDKNAIAGHYTVEELDQWINNEGPVIKTK